MRNMSLNFSHISSNVDKVLKLFLKKKILNKNHRNDSNMYFANLPLTLIKTGLFQSIFFWGEGLSPRFTICFILCTNIAELQNQSFASVLQKRDVLKNFTKFKGKHLRGSLFFKAIFYNNIVYKNP